MDIKNQIIEEKNDIKEIFKKIRNRDFSGNSGMAIKNSIYQFGTSIVMKFGSLLFTIILARLLMPELFGLYSLALGTIILFSTFSNFGEGGAVIKFISKSINENKLSEAKAYIKYLLKIKIFFLVFSISFLIISSKFLANNYYQKPLYLAFIAGAFYIIAITLVAIIESLLVALNNFKQTFIKEIVFQLLRLFVVPLVVILAFKFSIGIEETIFLIIFALSFLYIISFFILILISGKKLIFLKEKGNILSIYKKKEINKFLIWSSAIGFSGIFFGYVDLIMLGRFVTPEFIGYYQAAFSLVGSLAVLIPFSIVLFPIFSNLGGERLESGFRKSLKLTLIISFVLGFLIFILSDLIVLIIYGSDYQTATTFLRLLSFLIIPIPLTAIYNSYLMSRGKVKIMAIFLIFSTILNILLNYSFITFGLKISYSAAVIGACVATLISRYLHLLILFIYKKGLNEK